MNPAIAQATRSRHRLRLRYRGLMRTVLPLIYGIGSEGQELLRCWQVAGLSREGEPVGWKMFRESRMADIMPTNMVFTVAEIPPDFNPDDPLMVQIIASCLEREAVRWPPPRSQPQPLRNSRRSRS